MSRARHVEVLLVADRSMTDFHDQGNLETYLLTIMNMVYLTVYYFFAHVCTSDVAQYLTKIFYFSQGIITVYGPIYRQLHQSSCSENYSRGGDAISSQPGSVIECRRDAHLFLQVAARDEP